MSTRTLSVVAVCASAAIGRGVVRCFHRRGHGRGRGGVNQRRVKLRVTARRGILDDDAVRRDGDPPGDVPGGYAVQWVAATRHATSQPRAPPGLGPVADACWHKCHPRDMM